MSVVSGGPSEGKSTKAKAPVEELAAEAVTEDAYWCIVTYVAGIWPGRHAHARQLKEATRAKGEGICRHDLAHYGRSRRQISSSFRLACLN